MNYRTSYAKHSASTEIRPIDIKCEVILKTVQHHRHDHSKFQATISGVAGPLIAWCGGQICRPFVFILHV